MDVTKVFHAFASPLQSLMLIIHQSEADNGHGIFHTPLLLLDLGAFEGRASLDMFIMSQRPMDANNILILNF